MPYSVWFQHNLSVNVGIFSEEHLQYHYLQAPVVRTLDSAIHQINHYPVDKYCWNQLRYPLDSDLSGG